MRPPHPVMSRSSPTVPLPRATLPRATLLSFLGCMPLAVVILAATALAAAIGTLLRQGAPAGDYLVAYGPFWHTLFAHLGLYHFYSSPWFLAMPGFLLLSVGVCLLRNAYPRLRHLWRVLPPPCLPVAPTWVWESKVAVPVVAERMLFYLRARGFAVRGSGDGLLFSAARGRGRNLGYLLTHGAVLLICLGGLVDANPLLAMRLLAGQLHAESRDLPASQVPKASRLGADNPAFRAHVQIPEQATVDYAFLYRADGYLLQELPFLLTLKSFQVEFYRSGPPKAFISTVSLRDKQSGELSSDHRLEVNRPLRYRGYDLYQSDFGDGGSLLRLRLRDLGNPTVPVAVLEGVVAGAEFPVPKRFGGGSLRLDDFRPRNVVTLEPSEQEASVAARQVDHGASFSYTLTGADGTQRQFRNFVQAVSLQGREYLLSGVREFSGEDFHYLYIPLDTAGSPETFFALLGLLHDPVALATAVSAFAPKLVRRAAAFAGSPPLPAPKWEKLLWRLAQDLRSGGVDAVRARLDRDVPEEERRTVLLASYIRLLRSLLREMSTQLPDGNSLSPEFYVDALAALAARPGYYGTDLFLRLEDFELRRASGLIIARAPGRPLVYGGFLALIGGVFLLFYGRFQRLGIALEEFASGTRVKLAVYGLPPPADSRALVRDLRAFSERDGADKRGKIRVRNVPDR